jgi:hypothetical protein
VRLSQGHAEIRAVRSAFAGQLLMHLQAFAELLAITPALFHSRCYARPQLVFVRLARRKVDQPHSSCAAYQVSGVGRAQFRCHAIAMAGRRLECDAECMRDLFGALSFSNML